MASFQAKIVCKRQGKRENKNYSFVSFRPYLTHNSKFQKNCKKIAKKFKKLKNASMASFTARIGWKRPRKKENKFYRPVSFLPNA